MLTRLILSLNAILLNHIRAFFSSLGRLLDTPFTTLMTVAVMAITIALAGSFYLLVNNAKQLTTGLEATNQMSVFLKTSISDKKGQQLTQKLSSDPNFAQVNFISKSKALDEFKHYSGFGDALKALDENPLPAVIQILPKNTLIEQTALALLIEQIKNRPEVDFVQMDMQWLQRLQSILQLASRGVTLLNTLLGVAVIFITGNTIRLELQNRREEVLIAKLVGATHAFVQRPFVYTGFWLGFAAGITAWFIISIIVFALQSPLAKISMLYDSHFRIMHFSAIEVLTLLFLSSASGVIGAWVVLYYQLGQIKPK